MNWPPDVVHVHQSTQSITCRIKGFSAGHNVIVPKSQYTSNIEINNDKYNKMKSGSCLAAINILCFRKLCWAWRQEK